MKKDKYTAKTLSGLEDSLAEEIEILGGSNIRTSRRAVSFFADLSTLYKINISSRLVLRVLKPIIGFNSRNPDQLYRSAKKIDWSAIFSYKSTFAVDSVVNSKYFRHSKYAALKLKDAVVDQFRAKDGKRPSINITDPDFRINLHIEDEFCTISLDSSGDSLHKRGYRKKGEKAPLNEVLAAGMIKLSGWSGLTPFIDPMCGSGTIGIEAALIAENIPPNLGRSHFSFMKWKSFDKILYDSIKNNLRSDIKKSNVKIVCNDKNRSAVQSARSNARAAKVENVIQFHSEDFFKSHFQFDTGVLITNPPYGERIKPEKLNEFYKNIGDTLKKNYQGMDAWILSSNKELMKKIGLRTSRRLTLYNGALECKYHNYKLYEGSKKRKFREV